MSFEMSNIAPELKQTIIEPIDESSRTNILLPTKIVENDQALLPVVELTKSELFAQMLFDKKDTWWGITCNFYEKKERKIQKFYKENYNSRKANPAKPYLSCWVGSDPVRVGRIFANLIYIVQNEFNYLKFEKVARSVFSGVLTDYFFYIDDKDAFLKSFEKRISLIPNDKDAFQKKIHNYFIKHQEGFQNIKSNIHIVDHSLKTKKVLCEEFAHPELSIFFAQPPVECSKVSPDILCSLNQLKLAKKLMVTFFKGSVLLANSEKKSVADITRTLMVGERAKDLPRPKDPLCFTIHETKVLTEKYKSKQPRVREFLSLLEKPFALKHPTYGPHDLSLKSLNFLNLSYSHVEDFILNKNITVVYNNKTFTDCHSFYQEVNRLYGMILLANPQYVMNQLRTKLRSSAFVIDIFNNYKEEDDPYKSLLERILNDILIRVANDIEAKRDHATIKECQKTIRTLRDQYSVMCPEMASEISKVIRVHYRETVDPSEISQLMSLKFLELILILNQNMLLKVKEPLFDHLKTFKEFPLNLTLRENVVELSKDLESFTHKKRYDVSGNISKMQDHDVMEYVEHDFSFGEITSELTVINIKGPASAVEIIPFSEVRVHWNSPDSFLNFLARLGDRKVQILPKINPYEWLDELKNLTTNVLPILAKSSSDEKIVFKNAQGKVKFEKPQPLGLHHLLSGCDFTSITKEDQQNEIKKIIYNALEKAKLVNASHFFYMTNHNVSIGIDFDDYFVNLDLLLRKAIVNHELDISVKFVKQSNSKVKLYLPWSIEWSEEPGLNNVSNFFDLEKLQNLTDCLKSISRTENAGIVIPESLINMNRDAARVKEKFKRSEIVEFIEKAQAELQPLVYQGGGGKWRPVRLEHLKNFRIAAYEDDGHVTMTCGAIDTEAKANEVLKVISDLPPKNPLRIVFHQYNSFALEKDIITNENHYTHQIESKLQNGQIAHINLPLNFASSLPFEDSKSYEQNLEGLALLFCWTIQDLANIDIMDPLLKEKHRELCSYHDEIFKLRQSICIDKERLQAKPKDEVAILEPLELNKAKLTILLHTGAQLSLFIGRSLEMREHYSDENEYLILKAQNLLMVLSTLILHQTNGWKEFFPEKISRVTEVELFLVLDMLLGSVTSMNCLSGLDRTGLVRSTWDALCQMYKSFEQNSDIQKYPKAIREQLAFQDLLLMIMRQDEFRQKLNAFQTSLVKNYSIPFHTDLIPLRKLDSRDHEFRKNLLEKIDAEGKEEAPHLKLALEYQERILENMLSVALPITLECTGAPGLKYGHDAGVVVSFFANAHPLCRIPMFVSTEDNHLVRLYEEKTFSKDHCFTEAGKQLLLGFSQYRAT